MCNGNYWGGCFLVKTIKVLLFVGGLNWGLVGVGMLLDSMSNWNVVNMVFGSMPVVEGLVYLLVGVSAVMSLFHCRCAKCKAACTCPADNKAGGMGGGM